MTQSKWKVGFATIFILVFVSGCSTLAEFLPQLASPTITNTPGPTSTITPTKTMVTFNRWTSTPAGKVGGQEALPTWTPIPTQTLRPSWTPRAESTLRSTWTASPTLTPSITPIPTATPAIFRFLFEQFESEEDAWLQSGGENWAMDIKNGIYEMQVTMPNVEITSSRTWLKLAEVRMDAEIGFINGDGYAGFNCREGTASYYTLFVTSDGQYGLGHTLNFKQNFLILAPHPAIRIGQDNQLRAECRGNTITLWVNGTLVVREEVEALGPGFAGMLVGTRLGDDHVTVHFDDFQVWGPADYEIITVTPEGE
ncbi:MAG: hypothetical protein ISR58_14390 [Anaerolineales bacterium]|nr:hypothetical protein [Chloroflexota bacterium]MBL6982365.1 hypothetical protein [Anaerolineales bacterium]